MQHVCFSVERQQLLTVFYISNLYMKFFLWCPNSWPLDLYKNVRILDIWRPETIASLIAVYGNLTCFEKTWILTWFLTETFLKRFKKKTALAPFGQQLHTGPNFNCWAVCGRSGKKETQRATTSVRVVCIRVTMKCDPGSPVWVTDPWVWRLIRQQNTHLRWFYLSLRQSWCK